MKKDDRRNSITRLTAARIVLTVITLLLALFFVFMVVGYIVQNIENSKIKKQYEIGGSEMPTLNEIQIVANKPESGNDIEISEAKVSSEPISQQEADEIFLGQPIKNYNHDGLKADNPDYAAWIDIPNTKISYPVVRSADNMDYLKKSFDGAHRSSGTIFFDANIRNIKTVRNVVIHGHNMKSGAMFGTLSSYKAMSFYNVHPFIYLYTPDETMIYQVFSAYTVPHNIDEESVYQNYFVSDEEYQAFIELATSRSVIKTGVSVSTDKQIITLSTCVNHSASRFVVHAVRFQ
jgi:sortase B